MILSHEAASASGMVLSAVVAMWLWLLRSCLVLPGGRAELVASV